MAKLPNGFKVIDSRTEGGNIILTIQVETPFLTLDVCKHDMKFVTANRVYEIYTTPEFSGNKDQIQSKFSKWLIQNDDFYYDQVFKCSKCDYKISRRVE